MSNLREIKKRIVSVKKTRSITSALKMVAAAKFRKAQMLALQIRPYSFKIEELAKDIAKRTDIKHDFFTINENKKICIVVVTADRGLCGGFNTNLIRTAVNVVQENQSKGFEVDIFTIGSKGYNFFKARDYSICDQEIGVFDKLNINNAKLIGDKIRNLFVENQYNQIKIVYNQFKSAVQTIIDDKVLLPLSKQEIIEETNKNEPEVEEFSDYIYEPTAERVVDEILNKYIDNELYHILLESNAAEQGSRMTAMDAATDNANNVIEDLTLQYNKARQADITKELSEIVGGAEALK